VCTLLQYSMTGICMHVSVQSKNHLDGMLAVQLILDGNCACSRCIKPSAVGCGPVSARGTFQNYSTCALRVYNGPPDCATAAAPPWVYPCPCLNGALPTHSRFTSWRPGTHMGAGSAPVFVWFGGVDARDCAKHWDCLCMASCFAVAVARNICLTSPTIPGCVSQFSLHR